MSATRKVVINTCFGGFGITRDAERQLVGKCKHTKLMEPRDYYGNRDGWEDDFRRDTTDENRRRLGIGPNVMDGKVVVDEHGSTYKHADARECPALVELVERMGEACWGDVAQLRVVEIPADVAYTVEEYDGNEHIAEVHRTWP